jgi:hypothetical protein
MGSFTPEDVFPRNELSHTDRHPGKCDDENEKGRDLIMQGPLRGLLAGVAAWKLGGGCFSTIVIFLIVFYLLGFVRC